VLIVAGASDESASAGVSRTTARDRRAGRRASAMERR
jgi:hypothetical protein